ncbi:uroporphyrinogen-III C-methyltransferase [Pseudorhodobacter ferrugineus]|uniref:uroporphyrinogen-III C-methyltransferase n=1 Tax=Pseudorhodobacter ferrugineus TaxID=77008 RepID=UPI0003B5B743|nr:uroporphyrinogen-III C-methyltransferase [Pseudorhodobacter ferrugineus]
MKDTLRKALVGKVFLIGAGPGDPDLLTVKALRLIQTADVVVFDRLVSPEIMALIPAGTRCIDVGKLPQCHKLTQDEINALLVDLAGQGITVARLKGGDPLIFGRGSEEAAELREAGIAVEYVPGITAAQGAAASTGVPLTHRGLATGVRYVTGHRARDASLDLDWASLANEQTTLVVYMGVANIAEISSRLIAHGMSADLPVLAIASATTPQELRVIGQLDDIVHKAACLPKHVPVLFIIGHVVSLYVPALLQAALTCQGAGMDAYA